MINEITERFNQKNECRLRNPTWPLFWNFPTRNSQGTYRTGLISLRKATRSGSTIRKTRISISAINLLPCSKEATKSAKAVSNLPTMPHYAAVALNAQNVPPRVSSAFSRLFRDGVRPNFGEMKPRCSPCGRCWNPCNRSSLRSSKESTNQIRVTQEQYEQHLAYIRHLDGKKVDTLDLQLIGRALIVMAMLTAATFTYASKIELLESNGRLGLLALVVVCNLALVRLC